MLVLKLLQVVRLSIFCISLICPLSLSRCGGARSSEQGAELLLLWDPPPTRSLDSCHPRFDPASDRRRRRAPAPLPPPPLRLSERLRERGTDGGVEAGSTEERSIVDLAESRTSASARRPQIITLSGEENNPNVHAEDAVAAEEDGGGATSAVSRSASV